MTTFITIQVSKEAARRLRRAVLLRHNSVYGHFGREATAALEERAARLETEVR